MQIGIIHSQYRSTIPSGENLTVYDIAKLLEDCGHTVSLFSPEPLELQGNIPLQVRVIRSALGDKPTSGFEDWLRDKDVIQIHNYFPLLSKGDLDLIGNSNLHINRVIHNYRLTCLKGNNFRNGSECTKCSQGNFLPGVFYGCYNQSRIKSFAMSEYSKMIEEFENSSDITYIAISDQIADYLRSLGKKKIKTISNSVPLLNPILLSATEVLFVGRLEPEKGISKLLGVWGRNANLPLLNIVGDGSLKKQVEMFETKFANIRFHGQLSQKSLSEIACRCKISVIPGLWREPFGRVMAESFSRGQAIVTTENSVAENVIINGVNGQITGASEEEILEGVLQALRIPTAMHIEQNRSIWEEKYAPQNVKRAWEDYYDFNDLDEIVL